MDLPDWIRVGATFRYDYPAGHAHHGRKFHVRGIVDGLAVLREWWKHKQRWNYTIEGPEYFSAFGERIKVDK